MMPETQRVIMAALIFAGAFVVAQVVMFLLRRSNRITSHTRTDLDDILIKAIRRPVYIAAFLTGGFLALRELLPDLRLVSYGYPDAAMVLVAIWGAYTLNRVMRALFTWHEEQSIATGDTGRLGLFAFLRAALTVTVWGLALLLVLNNFGVDVTAMLAGFGIAGVAIALALQNTLSSVFSTLALALDKPIRQGDFIELEDGTDGFVEEIGMRSTRIRTYSNNIIIVPNTQLAEMQIKNYYLPKQEVSVVVPITVSYENDLDRVEEVTMACAADFLNKHSDTVDDFEPIIRFDAFGASAIEGRVILRAERFLDHTSIRHEFIKTLKRVYEEEGIEIPYTQYDVHLKKA